MNRLKRVLRPGFEGSVPGATLTERAPSEDSFLQGREVREAAYLRTYGLGEGGGMPYAVALVDLVLFGSVAKSWERHELAPGVVVAEGPGVPG